MMMDAWLIALIVMAVMAYLAVQLVIYRWAFKRQVERHEDWGMEIEGIFIFLWPVYASVALVILLCAAPGILAWYWWGDHR